MRSIIHLLLTGTLLGAVFAAFVPVAEAQGTAGPQYSIVLSLTPPSEKVKPLQGQITFQGKVEYTGDPSSGGNLVGVPVSYKVTKAPAWAAVTVSPGSDVIQLASGQQYSGSKTFTVAVTASDQAPAFQSDTIEITATVTPSSPGATPKSAAQTVPVQADYFSILDVQLAQAIQQDRPQSTVTFPVKITNLGNGATKVNFDIAPEGNPQRLAALIPGPVTLQSKQAGGNQISAEIPLQIQLPHKNGYMNEAGTVTYKITSNYALDSKLKGDETTLAVLVTTKGFYVPGPSGILLVGVLAVLAALVGRRSS